MEASCVRPSTDNTREIFSMCMVSFRPRGLPMTSWLSFVIFLASHDRPMSELLNPNRKDLKQVFTDQFEGMTLDPVPLTVLENAREQLIERINTDLTTAERGFLLSMKRLEPKWELLGMPRAEPVPGHQTKDDKKR